MGKLNSGVYPLVKPAAHASGSVQGRGFGRVGDNIREYGLGYAAGGGTTPTGTAGSTSAPTGTIGQQQMAALQASINGTTPAALASAQAAMPTAAQSLNPKPAAVTPAQINAPITTGAINTQIGDPNSAVDTTWAPLSIQGMQAAGGFGGTRMTPEQRAAMQNRINSTIPGLRPMNGLIGEPGDIPSPSGAAGISNTLANINSPAQISPTTGYASGGITGYAPGGFTAPAYDQSLGALSAAFPSSGRAAPTAPALPAASGSVSGSFDPRSPPGDSSTPAQRSAWVSQFNAYQQANNGATQIIQGANGSYNVVPYSAPTPPTNPADINSAGAGSGAGTGSGAGASGAIGATGDDPMGIGSAAHALGNFGLNSAIGLAGPMGLAAHFGLGVASQAAQAMAAQQSGQQVDLASALTSALPFSSFFGSLFGNSGKSAAQQQADIAQANNNEQAVTDAMTSSSDVQQSVDQSNSNEQAVRDNMAASQSAQAMADQSFANALAAFNSANASEGTGTTADAIGFGPGVGVGGNTGTGFGQGNSVDGYGPSGFGGTGASDSTGSTGSTDAPNGDMGMSTADIGGTGGNSGSGQGVGQGTGTSGSDGPSGNDGGAGAGGGAAGGGGDGGWIVCTELTRQGRMPRKYWAVGSRRFQRYAPILKRGYWAWAVPSVRHLKAHPDSLYSRFLAKIFNWRAENIAADAGIPGACRCWQGVAAEAALVVVCGAVGAFTPVTMNIPLGARV